MEEKLVTLAILTYSKAQILKNVLENEGIEACIHNVNLIQPVISSGVRIRIRESDLPRALKIIESSAWLAEDVVNEEKTEEKHGCSQDTGRSSADARVFQSGIHAEFAVCDRKLRVADGA